MTWLDYALDEELRDLAEIAAEYLTEHADETSAGVELGWLGVGIAEEFGGAGGTQEDLAVLIEAGGSACAASPIGFTSGVLGQLLVSEGERASDHLRALSAGDLRPLVPAVDPRGLAQQLTTTPSGTVEGRYLAYGTEEADTVVVPLGGSAPRVALLDAASEQVTVTRATSMDISRPLFDVELAGASTEDTRLMLEGDAVERMAALSALTTALDSAGVAKRALTDTLKFALQRHQFGRPVGSFQSYKHRLADAYVLLRLTQSAAFRAARSGGLPQAYSAAMDGLRNTTHICGEAVQLHGAMGFSWETGIHVLLKRARANELFWSETKSALGAPEIEEK